MLKDERDVLEVLKSELEYLSNGSYSDKESWGPRFIFEDSPTCLNYGHKDNPSPCSGCVLMDFVPREHRSQKFPCRYIPLDASGQTLDALYRHCDEAEVRMAVCGWLETTIERLQQERASHREEEDHTPPGSPLWQCRQCGQESRSIPLYEKFHPKCANPACPTGFHWLAGGKFFRFRPEEAGQQGVKHYWLCERCSHLFTLMYEQGEGVVLKPRSLGLPMARASVEGH